LAGSLRLPLTSKKYFSAESLDLVIKIAAGPLKRLKLDSTIDDPCPDSSDPKFIGPWIPIFTFIKEISEEI
jgi:hypothetical protein